MSGKRPQRMSGPAASIDEGATALSSLNTFLPSYDLRTSSSNFATLAAIRRASSRVSSLVDERRPG
jgi:hypothetical protein